MAWEAATKVQVSDIAGVREADLQDWWYTSAVDLIAEKAGRYNIADVTAVVDVLDGNGLSRISVRQPPISSVTSVTISDVVISSNRYITDGAYVVLIDRVDVNPYLAGDTFPRGVKNVSISYVSGAAGDGAATLAVALIIQEIANVTKSEGAESRLQFSGVDRASAQAFRYGRSGPGMTQRIDKVIGDLLGKRIKAR